MIYEMQLSLFSLPSLLLLGCFGGNYPYSLITLFLPPSYSCLSWVSALLVLSSLESPVATERTTSPAVSSVHLIASSPEARQLTSTEVWMSLGEAPG